MKKIEFVNGHAPYLNEENLNQLQDNMEEVSVPEGGTLGQVLTKASNTNNDVQWTTPIDGSLYVLKEDVGTIVERNYSTGTSAPSGGSNGDIYDQYFD